MTSPMHRIDLKINVKTLCNVFLIKTHVQLVLSLFESAIDLMFSL